MKKRVLVLMSGGVDSSVTAYLLKDEGFEVIGITMQIFEHSSNQQDSCCGMKAIEDAKKVANRLGIPHFVLNLRDIFREKIIVNFCKEYKNGRTPNPCIRCNQYIKFGIILKKAKQLNADYIATGHYAKIYKLDYRAKSTKHRKEAKIRYLLKKGIDTEKDQSYVLYTMTQEQLKSTLLPLGEFTKEKVRRIAKELDLPVAAKPESQEICFINDNSYVELFKKYIPESITPGPIVNKEGKVVGEHKGIIFYTVGQRKGLGIANKKPLYVIKINNKNNTIAVGFKEDGFSKKLIADNVNFISIEKLKRPIRVEVKIRYRHLPSKATIIPLNKDKILVDFDRPQWAITPGQSVVFYNRDEVVGGGTILTSNDRQFS